MELELRAKDNLSQREPLAGYSAEMLKAGSSSRDPFPSKTRHRGDIVMQAQHMKSELNLDPQIKETNVNHKSRQMPPHPHDERQNR